MEFGTNLTCTHVFGKRFTPKFCVDYNFLFTKVFIVYPQVTPICFSAHLYTNVFSLLLHWTKKYYNKRARNRNKKRIYGKKRTFKAIFYQRGVKFYTYHVRAFMTNSISGGCFNKALRIVDKQTTLDLIYRAYQKKCPFVIQFEQQKEAIFVLYLGK